MAIPRKKTEFGKKARQTSGTENKMLPFSDFLRSFKSNGVYSSDVDMIQWRFVNGRPVPVGILECTRVNIGMNVNKTYLSQIVKRYNELDFQGKAARVLASALKCGVWIILFREDCSEFWIYDLINDEGFNRAVSPEEMKKFLNEMNVI